MTSNNDCYGNPHCGGGDGMAQVAECCEIPFYSNNESPTPRVESTLHPANFVLEPSRPESRLDPRLKVWWPTSRPRIYAQRQQNISSLSDSIIRVDHRQRLHPYQKPKSTFYDPDYAWTERSVRSDRHAEHHPYVVPLPPPVAPPPIVTIPTNRLGYYKKRIYAQTGQQFSNRFSRLAETTPMHDNSESLSTVTTPSLKRHYNLDLLPNIPKMVSISDTGSPSPRSGPTDSSWSNNEPVTSTILSSSSPPINSTITSKICTPTPPAAASQSSWCLKDRQTLWCLVFARLSRGTLVRTCSLVSKEWWRWIDDMPNLWDEIDLNGRQNVDSIAWTSIGLLKFHVPMNAYIAWTGISKADLLLLLETNNRLDTLILSGCHFSTVGALHNCVSDLIHLDLRYVQGCTEFILFQLVEDASFKDLVQEAPRLKCLQTLLLSGCKIGDSTVRLLANQFTKLRCLDLSYCILISNLCIEVLSAAGCPARWNLTDLNLSGCPLLKSSIFGPLQRMAGLVHLELRECTGIPDFEMTQFEEAYSVVGKRIVVVR